MVLILKRGIIIGVVVIVVILILFFSVQNITGNSILDFFRTTFSPEEPILPSQNSYDSFDTSLSGDNPPISISRSFCSISSNVGKQCDPFNSTQIFCEDSGKRSRIKHYLWHCDTNKLCSPTFDYESVETCSVSPGLDTLCYIPTCMTGMGCINYPLGMGSPCKEEKLGSITLIWACLNNRFGEFVCTKPTTSSPTTLPPTTPSYPSM